MNHSFSMQCCISNQNSTKENIKTTYKEQHVFNYFTLEHFFKLATSCSEWLCQKALRLKLRTRKFHRVCHNISCILPEHFPKDNLMPKNFIPHDFAPDNFASYNFALHNFGSYHFPLNNFTSNNFASNSFMLDNFVPDNFTFAY